MSFLNKNNSFGDNGQSDRIADINANRAEGSITQEQFDDLMQDESSARGWIRLKRMAAFVLCAGIGAALIFS